MRRPSVSNEHSLLRKYHIVVETMCTRKKDILHCHDYVQLWYVFSGTLRHTLGNKVYVQHPGSCVIALPFIEHAIDTLDSEDTPVALSLSFTDNFLTDRGHTFFSYLNTSARFEAHAIPSFVELDEKRKADADKLARNMLSEFAHDNKTDFEKLCGYLTGFLRILCSKNASEDDITLISERANAIIKAVRYMADHLNEKIMREDLCTITAMSRTDFTRTFKAVTGTTTKEFLLGLRLRRAQYLLQYTDKSLNEIANDVGLYDKARLTHLFREHLGISPVKFRHHTRPDAFERDKETRRRMSFYPKFLDIDAQKK